jgi:catechol 2,3-dioxygenase-like lactoylglutathione lyase family enzyme
VTRPFLDHLSLPVADVHASRRFYEAALAPLAILLAADHFEGRDAFGFGPDGEDDDFWIVPGGPTRPPLHLAFPAPDHAAVAAFHRAALAAGGRDNGAPGLRPQYHATYYAAYVLDPDGHNIEAVDHGR